MREKFKANSPHDVVNWGLLTIKSILGCWADNLGADLPPDPMPLPLPLLPVRLDPKIKLYKLPAFSSSCVLFWCDFRHIGTSEHKKKKRKKTMIRVK